MAKKTETLRRPLIAGNWKMNGLLSSRKELDGLVEKLKQAKPLPCEILICPPATLIQPFSRSIKNKAVALGGQDCHPNKFGAHTGDISAEMLKDAGANWVIVGHSERRSDHRESDRLVKAKAEAALAAGLKVILCVGETEAQKDAGRTLSVVNGQLRRCLPEAATSGLLAVAYEPIWAIGTGRTPSIEDIAEVHAGLRAQLTRRLGEDAQLVRILYGGSVKPDNARDILSIHDVDGALVGGASLKAKDFWRIVKASK